MTKHWKENLRKRYRDVAERSSHVYVAKETGIEDYKLRTFVSRGVLKDDDARILEDYLQGSQGESTVEKPSAISLLAKQLRLLADFLDNPDFTPEMKGLQFKALIDTYSIAREKIFGLNENRQK